MQENKTNEGKGHQAFPLSEKGNGGKEKSKKSGNSNSGRGRHMES